MAVPAPAPTAREIQIGQFVSELERLAQMRDVHPKMIRRVLVALAMIRGVDGVSDPHEVVGMAAELQARHAARQLAQAVKTPAARAARGYDGPNTLQEVEDAAREADRQPGATRQSVESAVWQRAAVGDRFPEKMQRGLVTGLEELKKQRLRNAVVTHREVELGSDPGAPPATEENT